MDVNAAHSGFVFAAYGLSLAVLAVTIALNARRAHGAAAGRAGRTPGAEATGDHEECQRMSEETAAAGKTDGSAKRRRGWFAIIPLAVFLGLAGLFIKQLTEGGDPSLVPSALIGHEVPDFNLPPLAGVDGPDGQVPGLSSADLKTGKVTLVNVWASWCVPCREEHAWLMEMVQKHGVRLVSINYKDDPENARRFLGSLGVPFSAIGADSDGRVAINWGVYGVPESFVVDGKGVIRFKQIGPIVSDGAMGAVLAQIAKAGQQPN